jgi:hypothetical protein
MVMVPGYEPKYKMEKGGLFLTITNHGASNQSSAEDKRQRNTSSA